MKIRTFPWAALVIALLMTLSCSLPTGLKSTDSRTSSVRLSLSSVGRMVLPSSASLGYAVTLTNSSLASLSATFAPGDEVSFPSVPEGSWDVSVTALSGLLPVATGHLDNQVVVGGASVTWTVLLSGTQTGSGSYHLAVRAPNSMVLSAELFDTMNVLVPGGVTLTDLSSAGTSDDAPQAHMAFPAVKDYTLEATNLASGAYRLQLTFRRSSVVVAVYSEAVNVFDDVASDQWFDPTGLPQTQRTFTATDFASSNTLLGNLVVKSGSVVQPLSPVFSSNGGTFYINHAPTVTLTATAGEFGQTLEYQVNGAGYQALTPDVASAPISLATSGMTLQVRVTAVDGVSSNTYTLQLPTWRAVGDPPAFASAALGLTMDIYGTTPWVVATNVDGNGDSRASAYRWDGSWLPGGPTGGVNFTQPGTFGAQLAWDNWSNREYAFLGYGYNDAQSVKHVDVMSKVNSNYWYSMGLDALVPAGSTFQSVAVAPSAAVSGYSNVWVAYQDADQSGKLTVMTLANIDAVLVGSHYEFAGDWTVMGTAGFTPGAATSATMQFSSDGTPWVTYIDAANGNRASAMTFNGTSWVTVGAAGFSDDSLESLAMHLDRNSGKIAVVGVSTAHHASVYQYDPSTGSGWILLGNTDLTGGLVGPEPAVSVDTKGQVWFAYRSDSVPLGLTVKRFDGTSWQQVGVRNFSAATNPRHFALSFMSWGVPYLTFSAGSDNKAYAFKYDFTEVGQSDVVTTNVSWSTFAELSFPQANYTQSMNNPEMLELIPTFTGVADSWSWAVNGVVEAGVTSATYLVNPPGPGNYAITATVQSGGISYSATTTVLVNY